MMSTCRPHKFGATVQQLDRQLLCLSKMLSHEPNVTGLLGRTMHRHIITTSQHHRTEPPHGHERYWINSQLLDHAVEAWTAPVKIRAQRRLDEHDVVFVAHQRPRLRPFEDQPVVGGGLMLGHDGAFHVAS